MASENLIFNKDGNYGGASCWLTNPTISNGIITQQGDAVHKDFIPLAPNCTYRISFDLKFNTISGTNAFYIALRPFDSHKNSISAGNVFICRSGAETTLASAINNGDTTATLSIDSSSWDPTTYSRMGICSSVAWGYKMATYSQKFSSRDGATITFPSAWAGGSWPAGTKVNNFTDSSTYIYPLIVRYADFSTDWVHYDVDFSRSDSDCRWPFTDFVRFGTLGYTHNYSLRGLTFTNLTSNQICEHTGAYDLPSIQKIGIVKGLVDENIVYARYVKDEINGSSANDYNHWVEIQAYDLAGNNVAYDKPTKIGTGSYAKTILTDGDTATTPYSSGSSPLILDLEEVKALRKITVWHYWGDGRTYYDNKISVSLDGTNWTQVYAGEQPETSTGISVYLTNNKMSLNKIGYASAREIIED